MHNMNAGWWCMDAKCVMVNCQRREGGGVKMRLSIRECDTVMVGLGAWPSFCLGFGLHTQVSIGIRDMFLG